VFPQVLPAQLLTTTLVDFTTMNRDLQNAYSRQASLEVERALGRGTTVSAGYRSARRGDRLPTARRARPTSTSARRT
jgi:hypothetical protein